MQPLIVKQVTNRLERQQFLDVPHLVYQDDPVWVPPLRLEETMRLSKRSPLREHAEVAAFVCLDGQRPIGRITAQHDRLHQEYHHDGACFFGMLEALDDARVFTALFDAATQWARQFGARCLRGPISLSVNEEIGCLVEGFETPPVIMMPHGRPWYDRHITACGYQGIQDLLAYRIRPDFPIPPPMERLLRRTAQRITVRPLQRTRLKEELETMRAIFNDAWAGNWGYIPFTPREFQQLGQALRFIVDDAFVQVALVDNEPAAMIVMLPNLNEIIKDLDGRLFPTGLFKLLWRLKGGGTYPRWGRVALMGVRRIHQHSLLGAALALRLIHALRKPALQRGLVQVELSWILEQNRPMRDIIEAIGGIAYKRYRIYEHGMEAS
jgi:GNAT superfamily N-acetyltransferase